ncbi:MAG: cyclodeaminase/cyclohydrolase family protein [Thermoplasmata archaeon]|nr:cyclodeaminase/cyclohydrolase family protein [Thermoplasmata archaeon]
MAARTPTPGGGSASAATAALAAALGEMVLAYSSDPARPDAELSSLGASLTDSRRRFLALVEEDAQSYEDVRSARKARKAAPGPVADQAYVQALQRAAEVPLSTARLATDVARRLAVVRSRTKPALESDLVTALALFRAAAEGALANVEINLIDLKAARASTEAMEQETARLRTGV